MPTSVRAERPQICSVDNPELKLAVETYPPTGAVTLASIDSDWNTPHAQWVLHEIASGKYQIFLFSSSGHLCLQAAAPKIGAAVTVGKVDPANPTQMWTLSEAGDGEQQYFTPGVPGTELGFQGSIPIAALPLTLVASHDEHNRGDTFVVRSVY